MVDFHQWRSLYQTSVFLGPPDSEGKSGIARPRTYELLPVIKANKTHPAGDWWGYQGTLKDLRKRCQPSEDQSTAIPGASAPLEFPSQSQVVALAPRPTQFGPDEFWRTKENHWSL